MADRSGGRIGGGVMVLVDNDHKQLTGGQLVTPNIQATLCCIKAPGRDTWVACVYRSPGSSQDEDRQLLSFLKTVAKKNGTVVIVGDFSAPGAMWKELIAPPNTFGNDIMKFVLDFALVQHATSPKSGRVGNNPGFLDLVITEHSSEVGYLRITAPLGRSDYGVLRFTIPGVVDVPSPKLSRAYSKIDKPRMLEAAERLEWNVPCGSVEKGWQLSRRTSGGSLLTAPHKAVRKKERPAWRTSRATKAQQMKNQARRRFKRKGAIGAWSNTRGKVKELKEFRWVAAFSLNEDWQTEHRASRRHTIAMSSPM
ncbi:unnamed protein product [Echinostoma caproni]|uniref:Endo/exonuclease/phosphatase domain-containing protein n=1 Tax=Echinostoma caproni TaxID=27848 RepID=A0A183ARN5_9TREM|nr:unnamed protein product [Echinostoma caproni]